jgi:hypothetical protein
VQSLTDKVSVDSADPPEAPGHQSGKRVGMWVRCKSDAAIPANWLLWQRKKGMSEVPSGKTGSRGLKSLTKMVMVKGE